MLKKLDKLEAVLNAEIFKREEYYGNRSSEWKESEKGINYFEKTDLLREALVDIENAKNSIEQFYS